MTSITLNGYEIRSKVIRSWGKPKKIYCVYSGAFLVKECWLGLRQAKKFVQSLPRK